jgi:tetratricopeptide (TPR) repeat protein
MNRQNRRRHAKTNTLSGADRVAVAYAHHRRGDLAAAERLYREVLRDTPEQVDAIRLLGALLADRGQREESVALLQTLVALQPKNYAAHYNLGNVYWLGGRNEAAIGCYQAAIVLNPSFAGAYHGLGMCFRRAEREREAVECFRQAVRAEPGWAMAWKDMGMTLARLGDMQLAAAALRRAVAIDPGLGDAHRHLAAIRCDQAGANEIAALERRCADPAGPPGEKLELLFALGSLEDKAGRFETAFKHFRAANALLRAQQVRAGWGFDRAKLTRDVDRLMAAFPREAFANYIGLGEPAETPVFIVGMPRSGSTLFEQIAASHAQVFGVGERFDVGGIAARIGQLPDERWTQEGLQTNAADYLRVLHEAAGGALRVIDKMPDNIFMLGLIAALFPNARVIFCERDARDVALSCYFQRFAQPMGFDTDLADCAFRGREVARLTRHWRSVLPLRMMTLSYETLLAEPAAEARRLIEFLDLDWDPQCLKFYETKRPVRTASWSQVRAPLYQHSVGRWRHYAANLQGLEF